MSNERRYRRIDEAPPIQGDLGPGDFGYRTRVGRTGFDPFDQALEQGRAQGLAVRFLLTGAIRTHSPWLRGLMALSLVLMVMSTTFLVAVMVTDSMTELLMAIVPFALVDLLLMRSLYVSSARRRPRT